MRNDHVSQKNKKRYHSFLLTFSLFLGIFVHVQNANAANSVVAHYPFEGNTNDASGNGNNGINNGAIFAVGKIGQGLNFNGVNNFVNLGTFNPMDNNKVTMSAWVYPLGGGQVIIMKGNDATPNSYGLEWSGDNSVHLFTFGSTTAWLNSGPNTVPLNQWTHVAGVINGNTKSIYINGQLKNSATFTGTLASTTQALLIGAQSRAAPYQYFLRGSVDEVKLWNYALSAAEIMDEYNRAKQVIAYYPLEGNTNDASGNGNNAVNNGGTFAAGKIGQALNLNGTSNYVDLGTGNPIANKQVTMSAWVYPTGGGQVIIMKGNDATPNSYGLEWSGDNSVHLFTFGSTTAWLNSGPNTVPLNQWTHVAGVINGQTKQIYVNGVLKNSATFTGTLANTANSLWLGAQNRVNPFKYFLKGSLDEVKIWNYALSAAEIVDEYNRGIDGITKPVAHYPFEGETVDQTSNDASGNGHTVVSNSATFTAGKIGQGLNLNGVNNHADLGTFNPMVNNKVTMSAWVYPTGGGQVIIMKGNDATPNSYGLEWSGDNSVHLFTFGSTTAWLNSGPNTVPLNQWTHVVGVINGNTKSIYINGVLKNSATFAGALANTANSLWVGAQNRPDPYKYYLKGLLDEVKLWNSALSAAEIMNEYKRCSNGGTVMYCHNALIIDGKAETRVYADQQHFLSFQSDANGAVGVRPHPGLDKNGWGSTLYLQPFLPGAVIRGTNIQSVSANSDGINVVVSGLVSRDSSGSYGTWNGNFNFSYNASQKKIAGGGTYDITLAGVLDDATGNLNLYKLASNYLIDVPLLGGGNGNTGDMKQVNVSWPLGIETWVPKLSPPGHFPQDHRNPLTVEAVGDYNIVDTARQGFAPIAAAYKPTLKVILSSSQTGFQLLFGTFYDADKSRDFSADNVGITPQISRGSTRTSYHFDVTFDSTAIAGDH